MKLLIVEDNPGVRRMIRRIVEDLAEEINECVDGADALSDYRRLHPDCVLMDIKMQKMDGIAATREIKAAFPDARILIVTNYDDADLRESARMAGAAGYVVKENLMELRSLLAVVYSGEVTWEK